MAHEKSPSCDGLLFSKWKAGRPSPQLESVTDTNGHSVLVLASASWVDSQAAGAQANRLVLLVLQEIMNRTPSILQ